MKVQNGSFAMMGNNYQYVGKEVKTSNNAHVGYSDKANKTGSQNTANVSLSPNSQFDKMIESIQEQIQKVQENDRYDADTKKSKTEELEKQLKEIEKAKADQLAESALIQKERSKNSSSNDSTNNNAKGKSNDNGVILDLSINAKALIEADNSLKNLKTANSMKVKLEGASNVLASEIEIDKGRGVDTTKKEEELAQLKDGARKSLENMSDAIKSANNAAQDISEGASITIESNDGASDTENESEIKTEHEKIADSAVEVSNVVITNHSVQEK